MLEKKDADKYYEWLKEIQKQLPALSKRIFDLREKFYMGCGFHWYLERQLGKVIALANDYYDKDVEWTDVILYKVVFEQFLKAFQKLKSLQRN